MVLLNRVVRALETSLANARRTRVRRDLLERGERFLADNGFSRELLEQGNDAWPWRIDGTVPSAVPRFVLPPAGLRTSVPAAPVTNEEYVLAVTELSAYSDAELSDLGIARADVAEAVRHGRIGPDRAAGHGDERMAA